MKHIQHMIRKGTGRVMVAGMLIMSLMASMLPAYAMTGEVLGPETEGPPSGVVEINSWDELLGNFASPNDSQVIEIPAGTTIALTDSIRVPKGTWEINGGGNTIVRADGYTGIMLGVENSTTVTIRNVVIDGQSNQETDQAINLRSGTLSLEETTIRNNKINAFEDGAAINNYYGVLNVGNGCLIENNTNSNDNGSSAIYMMHGSDIGILNITGTTIKNNKGSYAIVFNTTGNDDNQKINGSVIEGSQIINNDGGIKLQSRLGVYDVSILSNNISGNTSAEDGGAISINCSSLFKGNIEIKGNTISNNTATKGGAIWTDKDITLENNTITGNEATEAGGAICTTYDTEINIIGGEISGNRDGTEDTRADSSGIRNGVNRNRKSVVSLSGGTIVSDGIEAGTVEVSGKVNMTGYLSTTTSVGYTVVGALDSDAFIEVKGNWGSSSDHVEDNQAETIYEVARPGDGYTITDQDFKAFKINGQSGHDNTPSGNLGLYMGEELNSLDYYRESYNGHVLAWRGPETGEPADQTYTIYWNDQLGNVSTSQQEYGKNLNMPYTPIDTSGQREFIGWFTEAEGGTQVTTSTVYQIEGNTTYYAHWKEKSDGPFKIYGKVTNANVTDEPLQNVSVRLVQGSANNVIGTATTDKDGNYVIENVPKGDDYFISFLSPINAVLPNQWDGRQLGTVDTDLEVNWQFIVYPVYLHITAKHEPTVPNDKITLTITDTNTTVVEEIQEGQIHSIKTVNVPMSYTIKAEDDRGNSKVVTQNLTETTEVTIILTEETQETGHTIYGTVKDRNTGTVISGMIVELWDTINNRKITETKTDGQGYYSFGDLADGQYDVVAVPDDTSISEVRQTVEISGEDEQVNLYVGLGAVVIETYKISGTVKDTNGNILAGATVTIQELTAAGAVDRQVQTDSNGYYEFTGVSNGVYTVTANSSVGNTSATGTVSNSDITVDLIVSVPGEVTPPTPGGDDEQGGGQEPVDPNPDDGDDGDTEDNKPINPNPGGDTTPTDPGDDDKEDDTPSRPSKPDDDNDRPSKPSKPDDDETGDKPEEPQEPEQPQQPEDTPEQPQEPQELEQPQEPEQPEQPQEPQQPEQPQEETTPPVEPTPSRPEEPEGPDDNTPVEVENEPDGEQPEPTPEITWEPEDEPEEEIEIAQPENPTPDDENDDTSSTDDRNDEDTSMTGASGTFNEMLRRVLYIAAFSILVLLGVGIIWLILIAWYRRVKVYNDKNTDDYEEENYEVVYKGYIKKEDKGIYYITIPEKIIEERTTDRFQIKLKELFVRRHNGDMLMVEIEGTKLSYSFEIDEKENMVKFTYADFVIEE